MIYNVFLETPYIECSFHMETTQLICNVNRLMGLCGVQIFLWEVVFQQTTDNHEGRVCEQVEKKKENVFIFYMFFPRDCLLSF